MNFTTLFIKRPVMTTLVMIGILVFGIVAYRQLPVSDLPNVDFPTITVSADAAGHEPADDGGDGGDAAREAVLDDRRHRQHDVDVEPRADADRHPVRARPEHRRRRAGRAGGDRADDPPAAAGHHPAVVPEDEPGRRADSDAWRSRRTKCRSRRSTSTARRRSRSGSRWSAAWRRCWCTARRSTRCASSSIPAQLASRGIALEDVATAVTSQNVNLPTGVLWGPQDGAHGSGDRASSTTRAQFGDIIVAYRNGAPVHLERARHASPTTCRTTRRRAGTTASGRSCWPFSGSRARTRSTSRTR